MTILVVGATGATGRLLVQNLLSQGLQVRAIVRSPDKLPEDVKTHDNLFLTHSSILKLTDIEMANLVKDCSAVISCLGHNLSLKGIYGSPRRLVTQATRRLCDAVISNKPQKPVKFVLMNTSGNSNRDIPEKISIPQKLVVGLIRLLLPPQIDNEKAADYLRTTIGNNNDYIKWVVVRPDTLINSQNVTTYNVYPSPIRSAIFNPGKTSRINVANFMVELALDDSIWQKWQGQMPVIYNEEK
jgi:nucleoside-diphosphate-sugar epimerase